MSKFVITAISHATEADVASARLGTRFGRMDLMSQLALLAVESLKINFDDFSRERIAICLAAKTGSLSTDVDYWEGRKTPGGFSPTLFTYTLPSAAVGELAIRHRLTGPQICFVGGGKNVLPEALDLIERGEVDGCVCVVANVISLALAKIISGQKAAAARAVFLQKAKDGGTATVCADGKTFADNFPGMDW
jgi:3-oxoacyl-(acyl-carrier-protein) synthase